MDQKKAKITYIISTAIYAALFLFGLGTGQTLNWIVMMTGPLGIAYNLKAMLGQTPLTRRITLGVQIFVIVCCAFWLTDIYFLIDGKPDAFSQAATWLFTVASVSRLVGILTGRK